jgi:hypothetical protein
MLMASLPPLPALFTSSDDPPISRLRLDRRLEMLEPVDRAELADIEVLMRWDLLPLEMTDREILGRAHEVFPRIRSDVLRDVAMWRLELRTIVAALRRRALGKPAPTSEESWGYGRWVRHIEKNWLVPDFGIGAVLPWLPEFSRLIDEGDSRGFEHALLGVAWAYMSRAAQRNFFSFEAVALYVLRWDVIARWTGYDGQRARERFNRLLGDGLGDYEDLFAAGLSEKANLRV